MAIIAVVSVMVFVFLWTGYSPAELVRQDLERRRAPPVPWRERAAGWVQQAPQTLPGFGPAARRELAQIGLSPGRYGLQMALVGGLVALVLGWDVTPWLAPLGFALGAAGVRYALRWQYESWVAQVTAQMSDVVVLVKARLQAGETVRQAVRHVAPQLPQPVRTEWQRLVDRLDAGYAFSEAIAALVDQVPDRDVAAVLHQLHVYDRDSVPPDPFGTLAAHLSRMKLVKRDYVVRRATSAITVYTGVAFFVAMVSMLGPTLYGLWVNSVGSMPL
jgi:Flp pilus assembly protein TadB